ncbi:MAG: hypothetical protein K5890_03590, partial [Bacteroidales bacterium]|nr:hypothetical protein [Bacteroidales bacterium]
MNARESMPCNGTVASYLCRNFNIHQQLRPTRIREKVMSKVFRITPKTIKRVNNTVLTPEMEIIVTTEHHTQ